MNLDLDNPNDFRESNTQVEDYFVVEFVAIPPDFDITNYLTLREQAGIFKDTDKTSISQIKKLMESIKCSPVLAVLNNAQISASSCIYLLDILGELGVILKSIHNPLRKDGYKQFLQHYEDDYSEWTYIRGQAIKRINFIIVNIFNLMNDEVINEAMCIAQNLQNYQQQMDKEKANLPNLDKE